MNIFVKPEISNKPNTPYHLTKTNVSDKGNRRLSELIALPTATKALLRKVNILGKLLLNLKRIV